MNSAIVVLRASTAGKEIVGCRSTEWRRLMGRGNEIGRDAAIAIVNCRGYFVCLDEVSIRSFFYSIRWHIKNDFKILNNYCNMNFIFN